MTGRGKRWGTFVGLLMTGIANAITVFARTGFANMRTVDMVQLAATVACFVGAMVALVRRSRDQ